MPTYNYYNYYTKAMPLNTVAICLPLRFLSFVSNEVK